MSAEIRPWRPAPDRKLPIPEARHRMERAAQRVEHWIKAVEGFSESKEFVPSHLALTALHDIEAALKGELR